MPMHLVPAPAPNAREFSGLGQPARATHQRAQSLRNRLKHSTFVRRLVFNVGARVLYYCGVLKIIGLLRQRLGARRMIVLMYHRVRPEGAAAHDALLDVERGISAERFEGHLRVLRWFGKPATLEGAYQHLLSSSNGCRTSIAVTFDDGYRDNQTVALPILQRYGVPATIFPVVASTRHGTLLWWDRLCDLLRSCDQHALREHWRRVVGPNVSREIDHGDDIPGSRTALAPRLCDYLLRLPYRQRDALLDHWTSRCNHTTLGTPNGEAERTLHASRLNGQERARKHGSDTNPRYLAWSELRDLSKGGVELGGHTIDHPVLTNESMDEAWEQIVGSRRELSQQLEVQVNSFAYPHGEHNAEIRRLVAQAGFQFAVSTEPGTNNCHTDPLCLRRVPISEELPFELAFKLAFYDCVFRAQKPSWRAHHREGEAARAPETALQGNT